MNTSNYLGMKPGDLANKPYAKYWNPEMQPMQEHVQQSLLHGAEAAELSFPLEEADRLLQAGYLELENGYTRLANGQIFAAILTKMPGVTGKMIDWWFGWHYLESQRYKLWHPRCHVNNGAKRMVSDDPNLSDKEKYLNNPLNKLIPAKWLAKLAGSLDLGRDMVVHCGMEMNHLASFLPALYADYHKDM